MPPRVGPPCRTLRPRDRSFRPHSTRPTPLSFQKRLTLCAESRDTGTLLNVIDLRALREDPDRLRASQRARGEDESVVDRCWIWLGRRRPGAFRNVARRTEKRRQVCFPRLREEREALLNRAKSLASRVKSAEAEAEALSDELTNCCVPCRTWWKATRRWAARTTTSCCARSARPTSINPRDHLELGERLGAIDTERGAKVSGAGSTSYRGRRAAAARAAAAGDRAGGRVRLHPDDHAGAGEAGGDGGHRLPRRARERGLPARGRRPLPGGHLGGAARRPTTATRSSTCRPRPPTATPAGRRASGGRPGRTARTRGASSGCTSSTRSRCSRTAGRTRRTRSTCGCWPGRRRCWPRSRCPTA